MLPIPEDQGWFWTAQWQAGECETSEQIDRGDTVGPFDSAAAMLAALHTATHPDQEQR